MSTLHSTITEWILHLLTQYQSPHINNPPLLLIKIESMENISGRGFEEQDGFNNCAEPSPMFYLEGQDGNGPEEDSLRAFMLLVTDMMVDQDLEGNDGASSPA